MEMPERRLDRVPRHRTAEHHEAGTFELSLEPAFRQCRCSCRRSSLSLTRSFPTVDSFSPACGGDQTFGRLRWILL